MWPQATCCLVAVTAQPPFALTSVLPVFYSQRLISLSSHTDQPAHHTQGSLSFQKGRRFASGSCIQPAVFLLDSAFWSMSWDDDVRVEEGADCKERSPARSKSRYETMQVPACGFFKKMEKSWKEESSKISRRARAGWLWNFSLGTTENPVCMVPLDLWGQWQAKWPLLLSEMGSPREESDQDSTHEKEQSLHHQQ